MERKAVWRLNETECVILNRNDEYFMTQQKTQAPMCIPNRGIAQEQEYHLYFNNRQLFFRHPRLFAPANVKTDAETPLSGAHNPRKIIRSATVVIVLNMSHVHTRRTRNMPPPLNYYRARTTIS